MMLKCKKQKHLACQKGPKLSVKNDLIALFLKHVKKAPKQTAIMTTEMSWCYEDLFHDVLLIKGHLESLNLNGPVAICLHRTPRLLSTLLALQWLEVPYVPIELNTPIERMRTILLDSKASLLLHDGAKHERFTSLPCQIVALMELSQSHLDSKQTHKTHTKRSKSAAYIIYTSGSTGVPKGVQISNYALSHFLSSMSEYFLNETHDVFLATTTIAFDIAALELYLPIWQGKTIFLANDKEHRDPFYIQQILTTYPIKLLQGTPAFWNMLCFSGWQGKNDLTALCGGEPLKPDMVASLTPRVNALWNMYGPTEATVWCAIKRILPGGTITVGRPIHNMEMWIMDDAMRPLPIGGKGELYISGIGLADGYVNRAKLTHEKFISYKDALLKRLYKTGDIASMTEDGEFILHGRVDNQIKLHGYRIELEDIESHIQSDEGVKACAAGVYQEQLIAYICCVDSSQFSEDALLQKLFLELPEFMVPNRLVYLEQLPLNSSGKVNRHALPKPENKSHSVSSNITSTEATLIEIWREALNIPEIDLTDNFFELGGHSLLAARIASQIVKVFNKKVGIQDIYHAPSVTALSEVLSTLPSSNEAHTAATFKEYSSHIPLTDFQFVLWMSNLFDSAVKKLNVVGRKRIKGSINPVALSKALKTVQLKHDVLYYKIGLMRPIQKSCVLGDIQTSEKSLRDLDERVRNQYLDESMKALYAYQRWKSNKPLILVRLFHLDNECFELQVSMSHMISDQQSLEIFLQDLSNAYLLHTHQGSMEIKLEAKSFETYVRDEREDVHGSLPSDESFWCNYLNDACLFPFYKKDMVFNTQDHAYSSFFKISDIQLEKWHAFCVKHAITLNDLMCAAVGVVLAQYSKASHKKKIIINRVQSTREDPYFDDVIGCFLRTHIIKLDLNNATSLLLLAKNVQHEVLETEKHQKASALIKLSSIGRLKHINKGVKPKFLTLLMQWCKFLKKPPYYLSLPMLRAYKKLTTEANEAGFLINVNIWDNFFLHAHQNNAEFLGCPCQELPSQQIDIFSINKVLDVCLLRDGVAHTPYIVLSANLKPAIRDKLARELFSILNASIHI